MATEGGGAIANGGGFVTVTGMTFAENTAINGAAIASSAFQGGGTGSVTVIDSTFTNNLRGNFAIEAWYVPVTIVNSTFTNSAAGAVGTFHGGAVSVTGSAFTGHAAGAILAERSTVTIADSTFADNGGAGALSAVAATVTNSTFVRNTGVNAGAIFSVLETTVTNSTFVANTGVNVGNGAAGAIMSFRPTTLAANIFVRSSDPAPNCRLFDTVTDAGYNVADDGSCGLTGTGSVSDSTAIAGYLGPLGDHGGRTPTIPLLFTSTTPGQGPNPAYRAIPATFTVPGATTAVCALPDQRGVARTAPCDIGAFELGPDAETLETLIAVKDSFLRKDDPNRNEGANPGLRLQASGDNRVLVGFDQDAIDGFGSVTSATLVLTIAKNADNWGPNDDRTVDAHPLAVDFAEGNGQNAGVPRAQSIRGNGPGVTWNCAVDAEIANHRKDCDPKWNGGDFGPATAAPVMHFNGLTGEVRWNVTDDVRAGVSAWLDQEDRRGPVRQGELLLAGRGHRR